MKRCVVFYETWQMECCGTEFYIGDNVKWLVYKSEHINSPIDIGQIDYCYEAHSSEWENLFVLEGRVEKINILYHKYEPSKNNPRLLVPVGGQLVESEGAEGFEEKYNNLEASGYMVVLDEYVVRPAKKEEVIFK